MKACVISLGCPKNLADSEVLMGKLRVSGYQVISDPDEADIVIVNTCAFLKAARDEAREVIKALKSGSAEGRKAGRGRGGELKSGSAEELKAEGRKAERKVYIAGCLPIYMNRINSREKTGADGHIDSIGLFGCREPKIKATPPWTAYVKISEGCDNRCTYCLIPKIRGRLRHRKPADIIKEVKWLAGRGVKEIILIAQDTTAYPKLHLLIKKAAKINGIKWIRIMYAHPAHITDKLIAVMAAEKKVVKYLDLPIQHGSDKILKLMNRKYTRKELTTLISELRTKVPGIAIRTSVITGFPGETQKDYNELVVLVKELRFDRLGVFPYSREKGTAAYKMKGQVGEALKRGRAEALMKVQAKISREINKGFVGKEMDVIVESRKSKVERGKTGVVSCKLSVVSQYIGRTYRDAPEIDGKVIVKSRPSTPLGTRKSKVERIGEFVKVRITRAGMYDLEGYQSQPKNVPGT